MFYSSNTRENLHKITKKNLSECFSKLSYPKNTYLRIPHPKNYMFLKNYSRSLIPGNYLFLLMVIKLLSFIFFLSLLSYGSVLFQFLLLTLHISYYFNISLLSLVLIFLLFISKFSSNFFYFLYYLFLLPSFSSS